MSFIQLSNYVNGRVRIAIIGEAVDLHPIDLRFSYTYAITSHPSGSTATFSGSTITPDVVGAYLLTVTAGTDSLAIPVYIFSAAVYSGLAPRAAGVAYSDAERRIILTGAANSLPTATLDSWNAGIFPTNLNILSLGGR